MRRCAERLPGGLAAGRCPEEFDQVDLRRGIEVELEHTGDLAIAREIAMDHLVEDPRYYEALAKMEADLEATKNAKLRLRFETGGDSNYGQWDGWIAAFVPRRKKPVGVLEWSEFDGKYYVNMVAVHPDFRRRGVATELYLRLFDDQGISSKDLEPSMRTEEGDFFRKGAALPNLSDVDTWYQKYRQAVNMTASELRRWSKHPCSKKASLDRGPVKRNLHLLTTPRRRWGAKEVGWAKKTVSFIARMRAVSPGRPASKDCPSKRDIALLNWAYDPMKATPNRGPKVLDAEEMAANLRKTFQAAEPEYEYHLPFSWPSTMQNIGDSLAVAYNSDKWKKKGQMELYKHLAESRNRALVVPGLLHDFYSPGKRVKVRGPMVSLHGVPLPKHFAVLALFEEVDLKLYTDGTDDAPRFGSKKDEGVVKVTVRHGMLGASKILWSREGKGKDQPFLFVYTEKDGVLMLIVGEELDVEADGIVG